MSCPNGHRPGVCKPGRRCDACRDQDARIRTLAGEASAAGDRAMVRVCGLALGLWRPGRGESRAAARAACLAALRGAP